MIFVPIESAYGTYFGLLPVGPSQ